jgi:hypothetical protein
MIKAKTIKPIVVGSFNTEILMSVKMAARKIRSVIRSNILISDVGLYKVYQPIRSPK